MLISMGKMVRIHIQSHNLAFLWEYVYVCSTISLRSVSNSEKLQLYMIQQLCPPASRPQKFPEAGLKTTQQGQTYTQS